MPCGGVSVPQSDGVIRRAGEEGGRRQTSLRHIGQLRIHLKDQTGLVSTPNLAVEIPHLTQCITRSCNSTSSGIGSISAIYE